MFRKAGDEAGVAWTLNYQGDVAREKTDLARRPLRFRTESGGVPRTCGMAGELPAPSPIWPA